MLSVSDMLNSLLQTAATVAATVGAIIAWQRWRQDRQRPAPVFEVHGGLIPQWPTWNEAQVTIRNTGPAAIRIVALHPGRMRFHRVVLPATIMVADGYGGRVLPALPPSDLPPLQLTEIVAPPAPDRPRHFSVLVAPGGFRRVAPRRFVVLWHWSDQPTKIQQTTLRF